MVQRFMLCVSPVIVGLLASTPARGATIAVPANGDLQAAINGAKPGDVITLTAGAVYTGNFVLPANGNPGPLSITIRSGASPATLPPAGQRIMPAHASQLPQIKSPNTSPALQTAPGAKFWVMQYLEFGANDRGYGDIIALGSGDPAVQTSLAQVPSDLVIDHCYIHGDAASGQKRGIALNSGKTDIIDSYISDIKAIGFETQAIAGWNGPGPYKIVNNYIEGAGINFLLGGADPGIPNLVPTGIEFKRNHVTKQVGWRQPALGTPANVKVTAAKGGGPPQDTVYYYTIVAAGTAAMDTAMYSRPTAEASERVTKKGTVTVTWNAVPGASRYRVYRNSVPNSPTRYFETTSTSFVDNGGNPPNSGGIPGAAAWTVKNLFELKNAKNVVVDGNVLENNWSDAQTGYAVLFTVRNQDGGAPWSTVESITFTNNIVRHAPGGINILGRDDLHPSGQVKKVTVSNNLFDDLTNAWGNSLPWLLLGNGADELTFDHNTVVHTGPSLVLVYAIPTTKFVFTNNMGRNNSYGVIGDGRAPGNDSINFYLPGAVFSKSIIAGANPANYPATNQQCGRAGETCYPSDALWQAQFVNFGGGNYRLLTTSPYARAGSGGTDLGANIDAIMIAASPGS
jgi:hypothetical protein